MASIFDQPTSGGGSPSSGQTEQQVINLIDSHVQTEAHDGNTTPWPKSKIPALTTDDVAEASQKYITRWSGSSGYKNGNVVIHNNGVFMRQNATGTVTDSDIEPNDAAEKLLANSAKNWLPVLLPGIGNISFAGISDAVDVALVAGERIYFAYDQSNNQITATVRGYRGAWQSGTAYSEGDIVKHSDALFYRLTDTADNETSPATNIIDGESPNNATGKWEVMLESTGGSSGGGGDTATGDLKTKSTPLVTFTTANDHNVHFLDGAGGRANIAFPTFDVNKMYNLEVIPSAQSARDTAIINKTFSGRTFEGLADTTTTENSTGIVDDNFRKFEGPAEETFDLLKKSGKLGYQANTANFYGATVSIYELQAEGVVVGAGTAASTELFNANVNITAQNTLVDLTGFTLATADIKDDDSFLFEAGQPLQSTEALSTEVTGKEIKRAGTIANNATGNHGGSSFAQLLVINRNTGVELGVILVMRKANGQMVLQISASSQGDQYDPMPLRVTRRRFGVETSSGGGSASATEFDASKQYTATWPANVNINTYRKLVDSDGNDFTVPNDGKLIQITVNENETEAYFITPTRELRRVLGTGTVGSASTSTDFKFAYAQATIGLRPAQTPRFKLTSDFKLMFAGSSAVSDNSSSTFSLRIATQTATSSGGGSTPDPQPQPSDHASDQAYFGTQNSNSFASYDYNDATGSSDVSAATYSFTTDTTASPRGVLTPSMHWFYIAVPVGKEPTSIRGPVSENLSAFTVINNAFTINNAQGTAVNYKAYVLQNTTDESGYNRYIVSKT